MRRKSFRSLLLCLAFGGLVPLSATAQDTSVVRLPGTGQVKAGQAPSALSGADRLIPGGGLLLSFDTNADAIISDDEIESGIETAFAAADQNRSGGLTPIEQIRWAESLPTHDTSLANPVRFDPNLDRRVSAEEFRAVILSLAEGVTNPETGVLSVEDLKARDRRGRRGERSNDEAANTETRDAERRRRRSGPASGGSGSILPAR